MEEDKMMVDLTKEEIDDIITCVESHMHEYCISEEEEKPYKILVEKLEGFMK